MIVAAESNFVLQLALEQEEGVAARSILDLAASGQIRLVIPACALFEPYETMVRRHRRRDRLLDEFQRPDKRYRHGSSGLSLPRLRADGARCHRLLLDRPVPAIPRRQPEDFHDKGRGGLHEAGAPRALGKLQLPLPSTRRWPCYGSSEFVWAIAAAANPPSDVCKETSVHRILAPMNVRTHFACTEADAASAPSRRLRTALALHEDGVAMKRAQLRRQNRAASDEEIARRLSEWLRTRPGATHGDAEGTGKLAADRP